MTQKKGKKFYPDNNKSSNNHYLNIYKNGKYTIIKISGELLEHDDFQESVYYIKFLKEQNIPIILVYGGGNQISKKYLENTRNERKKGKDGNNITDDEVLEHGVIPAYNEILKRLLKIFGEENLNIFSSENMISEKIEGLGNVGKPIKFNKKLEKDKINLIGFVGIDEEGNKLNNNADDVAQKIALNCSENNIEEEKEKTSSEVNNILYLTSTGGLLDKKGHIVPFINTEDLDKTLEGNHDKIKVEGGMLKKLKSIKEQLQSGISKITVTDLKGLKKEIETGEGSGTMFVNSSKIKFSQFTNFPLFKEIYTEQNKKGNWKNKNDKELNKTFDNYKVLKIDNTILGGYGLSNFKEKINGEELEGKLIENLFSSKNGGGIGTMLGKKVKEEDTPIFAYSKEEDLFSSKNGGGIGTMLGKKVKEEDTPIFAYSKEEDFFSKIGFKKVKKKRNKFLDYLEKIGLLKEKYYTSKSGAFLWKYENNK